jgi:hypothetical protein
VTDKRLNVHTSSTTGTTTSRGTGGSHTRTTRQYYLYIDAIEYPIEYKEYSKAKVGAQVILEWAPKSKLTLSLTTIEATDIDRDVEDKIKTSNTEFLGKTMQEVRFSDEDLKALKTNYKADKKRRFVLMAPVLFLDLTLLMSGLWAILLFLFPLILIPLYQFFKMTRSYLRYRKNMLYGHKLGLTTLVEDKLTFTSNRSGNANRIKTTRGTIKVNRAIYEKLSVGDKIILFTSKIGNQPLSLMTLDKEEFHLA